MVDDKINNFCVSSDYIPTGEAEEEGLTMGFDTEHGSFVWVCGKCGAYKNAFRPSDRKDFYYCVKCKQIAACTAIIPKQRLEEL